MDKMDLGPEWLWRIIAICAVIGALAVAALGIYGVIWLISQLL